MHTLLEIARAVRETLYDITSMRVFGVEFDVVLHFVFAAAIFVLAERRVGPRRAAWLLVILIVVKEVVDLFLKSQLRYIKSPTPEMLADIGTDVLTGIVGALAAFLWTHQRRRKRAHSTAAS